MSTREPAAVVVTGAACVLLEPCDASAPREARTVDPGEFLRVRKSRKDMGVQDDLAVVAAGRALASARVGSELLGEHAGLYLAVGYLSFEQADITPVLDGSIADGRFSMKRFGADGLRRAHPLLTFRCLPNMPAYHVSVNFDVRGPYLVTYPGAGQFYQALEEACDAIARGQIARALVGAVANQRNFLVAHHFARIDDPVPLARLRDVGACLVLESEASAKDRGAAARARLVRADVAYRAFECERAPPAPREDWSVPAGVGLEPPGQLGELGPAGLAAVLARCIEQRAAGTLRHEVATRDGFTARSEWEIAG